MWRDRVATDPDAGMSMKFDAALFNAFIALEGIFAAQKPRGL